MVIKSPCQKISLLKGGKLKANASNGFFNRPDDNLSEDLDKFMAFHAKYTHAIDTLLSSLNRLHLKDGTQAMLGDMVNHERDEAVWSKDRIETLLHKQQKQQRQRQQKQQQKQGHLFS